MYEQQQQRQQHRSLVKTASVLWIKIHSQPSSCSSRWSYSPRSRRTTFAHQTGWHAPFASLTFFQPLSTFIHWGLKVKQTKSKMMIWPRWCHTQQWERDSGGTSVLCLDTGGHIALCQFRHLMAYNSCLVDGGRKWEFSENIFALTEDLRKEVVSVPLIRWDITVHGNCEEEKDCHQLVGSHSVCSGIKIYVSNWILVLFCPVKSESHYVSDPSWPCWQV